MKYRTGQTIPKRRLKVQKKARSKRLVARDTEWERVDDQLDEALKQTFPASDALSITQIVRCG